MIALKIVISLSLHYLKTKLRRSLVGVLEQPVDLNSLRGMKFKLAGREIVLPMGSAPSNKQPDLQEAG